MPPHHPVDWREGHDVPSSPLAGAGPFQRPTPPSNGVGGMGGVGTHPVGTSWNTLEGGSEGSLGGGAPTSTILVRSFDGGPKGRARSLLAANSRAMDSTSFFLVAFAVLASGSSTNTVGA